MYPRNAVSPERIAVGAVVQISDGAVQSAGVSITVRGQGGAEAAGVGTLVHGASGIAYYTPTQAETDFTSYVVIASKAACLPVAQTIITTASTVPGNVILASATHTGAVVPSVTTVTGNVVGSVGSIAAAGIAANSLSTAAKNDIADFVLDRNMATGTDSGTDSTAVRTPRQALRVLRNKTTIAVGVATVTKEDDVAASWTAAVTTAAGNPISGVDPT